MNKAIVIAWRVFKQLIRDKKYLLMSTIAPTVIIYFLKVFMDTLPLTFSTDRYIMPMAAFVIFFSSFLLSALSLVQERVHGTLERIFISGGHRFHVILGYLFGYCSLASVLSLFVLIEVLYLFNLTYSFYVFLFLYLIMWLLSIISILFGIFISTFSRSEIQFFPFIPLVSLPSIFLSGLLVDIDKLPYWCGWVSKLVPLSYANNIIQKLIKQNVTFRNIWLDIVLLIIFGFFIFISAIFTFREQE